MPIARTRDGVEIAYRAAGEAPPNVLFMHGWAGSGAYFDETLEHLDLSRQRAITFDFRGHGDSGPSEAYGLDDLAADVLAVADHSSARTFVLVGFSMSGKFAQYVSCTHPDRVVAQILVAGCPAGELPLPPEMLADWYARAGSAERMIDLVKMFCFQPVSEAVLERFGRDAARVQLVGLQGTIEAVTSTSFVERLGAAVVPTLVIGGLHDQIFSPDALRDGVVAPVRGAQLELLDCGHEIPSELPHELAELIEAFVEGLD